VNKDVIKCKRKERKTGRNLADSTVYQNGDFHGSAKEKWQPEREEGGIARIAAGV
jgi:hypothetical protein